MLLSVEESLFKIVVKLWDKFPDYGQAMILVGIFLILFSFAVKISWSHLETIFYYWTTKKGKINKKSLEQHHFYSKLDYWINYKIDMLLFGDTNRNKLFRKILKTTFQTIKENLEKYSHSKMYNLPKDEFSNMSLSTITDIVTEYNTKFKLEFEKELYDLVIDGEKGYNQWFSPSINYSRKMIQSICNSDIYDNNVEKCWAILNTYQSILDASVLSMEKTFKEFNGDLDKIFDRQ